MGSMTSRKGFWLASAALTIGVVSFAQAQSNSPFSSKKSAQAWQTQTSASHHQNASVAGGGSDNGFVAYGSDAYKRKYGQSQPASAPVQPSPAVPYHPPARQTPIPPVSSYGAPQPSYPTSPAQGATQYKEGGAATYYPQNNTPQNAPQAAGVPPQTYAHYRPDGSVPGASGTSSNRRVSSSPAYTGRQTHSPGSTSRTYGTSHRTTTTTRHHSSSQSSRGQYSVPSQPRSWKDRLGLGNLATSLSGFLKAGAAYVLRDDAAGSDNDISFIGDGQLRGEASFVTRGGLEYGAGLEVRAQYDEFRRGFGGRVGDCPAANPGCASTLVGGVDTSLRGHTSRFYADGPSDAKEFEFALEGAYVFLRSAYGDITVGRDDGAAYLFSLGAPSLVAVGASNSSVDYTGLDSVKTVNDASGFSEKIVYTSPRLLGDTIGVGVQFGVSYALDATACGVDYCVRSNDPSGAVSPDLENVIEAGIALDRTFGNGLSVEATATYATASEDSGVAGLDDLSALGLGLELGYGDFTLGGSYLASNNGLADGDYTSYDVGLTWKPSAFGVTLGYGHATDDNVNLTSDQFLAGVSYDIRERFRVGAGAQYIDRTVPNVTGGVVGETSEDALALFVEGGFTF